MANQRVFRPLNTDASDAELIRECVREARRVLNLPTPDTFLGRKTQEPFPAGDTDGGPRAK